MGAKTRCNIFFHWPIIYEAQKIPWTDLGMCTKIGLWPIPIFRFRSKIAPWEMNGLFHNFASEYSRDLVLMSTPGLWGLDIWDIFRSHRLSCGPRTGWRGGMRPRTTSRGEIETWALNRLQTWFWRQTQCFLTCEIIWDHFHDTQINLKVKKRVYWV